MNNATPMSFTEGILLRHTYHICPTAGEVNSIVEENVFGQNDSKPLGFMKRPNLHSLKLRNGGIGLHKTIVAAVMSRMNFMEVTIASECRQKWGVRGVRDWVGTCIKVIWLIYVRKKSPRALD